MSNVGAICRISWMSSAVTGVGVDMPSRRSREPVTVISSASACAGIGSCASAVPPHSETAAKAANPMSLMDAWRRLVQRERTATANFEVRVFGMIPPDTSQLVLLSGQQLPRRCPWYRSYPNWSDVKRPHGSCAATAGRAREIALIPPVLASCRRSEKLQQQFGGRHGLACRLVVADPAVGRAAYMTVFRVTSTVAFAGTRSRFGRAGSGIRAAWATRFERRSTAHLRAVDGRRVRLALAVSSGTRS